MQLLQVDIRPKYRQRFRGNEREFSDWILEAALQTELYLQLPPGTELVPGDLLRSDLKIDIVAPDGRLLDQRPLADDNLLIVLEVRDDYAVARIDNFGYQTYFDRILPELLSQAPPEVEFMDLYPYRSGQPFLRIDRAESQAWSEIKGRYNQLTGEYPATPQSDVVLYREIIKQCAAFLERFDPAGSYFYPDALYQQGFALHKLKRFAESNRVFHRYLNAYPNGPSVRGARSWISENNQHLEAIEVDRPKTKILFLAASPLDMQPLRLDSEIREIDLQLRLAQLRDEYELIQKWAVTPAELQQALLDHQPDIVHFSGHGFTQGIALADANGQRTLVTTQALAGIFRILADNIRCVVMNACYSKTQALEIARHIPYVIGMNQAIPNSTATQFSIGFYKGIGAGRSIEVSFALGRNMIELNGYAGAEIPELVTREGSAGES